MNLGEVKMKCDTLIYYLSKRMAEEEQVYRERGSKISLDVMNLSNPEETQNNYETLRWRWGQISIEFRRKILHRSHSLAYSWLFETIGMDLIKSF